MPKKKHSSAKKRARNRNPPDWERCRAVVIGLNGLGFRIAQLLAASGIADLKLVDHQNVKPNTRQSEGYDAIDVGRPKIHAAVQRCHEIHPTVGITGTRYRRPETLKRADLVFDCSPKDKRACTADSRSWPCFVKIASSAETICVSCLDEDIPGTEGAVAHSTLSTESAFIVAGVAVRAAMRFQRGFKDNLDVRFSVIGLSIRIEIRPSK